MKYTIRIPKYLRLKDTLRIDGVQISIPDLSLKVGIPEPTLQAAVSRGDKLCLNDWLVKADCGYQGKCCVYWHGCEYQFLADIKNAVGIGNAAVSIRLKKWIKDGDTDQLYRPLQFRASILKQKRKMFETRKQRASVRRYKKRQPAHPKPVVKLEPRRKRFNRTEYCFRDHGQEKCINYDSCNDHRIYNHGKFHPRQMEDGSCYDGERIKACIFRGLGQVQDVVQHTVNRY